MSIPNTIISRNNLILSHIMAGKDFQKTMNSTAELRDYLIADEIQRLSSLTKEELVRELIEIKSRAIEQMSDKELLTNSRSK